MYDFNYLKSELSKATKLDKNKKYDEAYEIYINCSKILVTMKNREKDQKLKKVYTDYATTYISRAELIKKHTKVFKAKPPRHSKSKIKSIPPALKYKTPKPKVISKDNLQNIIPSNTPDSKEITIKTPISRTPPPPLSQTYETDSASSSDGDEDELHVPNSIKRETNQINIRIIDKPPIFDRNRPKIKKEFKIQS